MHVVLVRPQLHINIGLCIRAMANFGFYDLHIVNPREDFSLSDDVKNGSADGYKYVNINVYDNMEDCVKNFSKVIGTSIRIRTLGIKCFSHENIRENIVDDNTAIVFGSEASGLSNEEMALCDEFVYIKSNNDFSSLNISHAVAVILSQIGRDFEPVDMINKNFTTQKLKEKKISLNKYIIENLEKNNYFKSENKKEVTIQNIQSLVNRIDYAEQVDLMFGILKNLK